MAQLGMSVAVNRLLGEDAGPQDVNAYFGALGKIKSLGLEVRLPKETMDEINEKVAESRLKVKQREAH